MNARGGYPVEKPKEQRNQANQDSPKEESEKLDPPLVWRELALEWHL